jgi:hypothetical protein
MLTGLAIAATAAVLWYLGMVGTVYLDARLDKTDAWAEDYQDWFFRNVMKDGTFFGYAIFWPLRLLMLASEGLVYLSFLAAKKGAEDWKAKNSTSSQSDSAK